VNTAIINTDKLVSTSAAWITLNYLIGSSVQKVWQYKEEVEMWHWVYRSYHTFLRFIISYP